MVEKMESPRQTDRQREGETSYPIAYTHLHIHKHDYTKRELPLCYLEVEILFE